MKTNRREFAKTLGAGFLGTGIGLCFSEKLMAEIIVQSGEITADTKYGKIRGTLLNEVGVFRGIPYAGASDGANRFLPPTPLSPWTGIREAYAFGPKSYQANTTWIDQSIIMRENCQFLNIWTPSVKGDKKLPVMFWNHGGGFTGGPSVFDGTNLAKTGDVVVVTHTHRLGLFGYLYLGHIDGKYAQSGNAGMLDILAALRWVKENISNFGGDPDNVTIFGQSGGGGKVSTLMAMPLAAGLFHKAIIQSGSGSSITGRGVTKEDAIVTSDMVFNQLNLKPGDIKGLLSLPAQTLIDKGIPSGRGLSPVVDGVVLPSNTYDPAAYELSANVPLIIGTNKDEQGRPPTGDPATMEAIRNLGGDNTDELLTFYQKNYPEYSLGDIFCMLNADAGMRRISIAIAERKMNKPAPVFMYRFDYGEVPVGGRVPRSKHSGELTFVFNCVGDVPQNDPAYITPTENTAILAKKMSLAWASFAHSGNPDHSDLPHWPVYNMTERPTMIFDIECLAVNDPGKEVREIFAVN